MCTQINVLSKNTNNIIFFHLKISIFYSREILLYITWACLHNVVNRVSSYIPKDDHSATQPELKLQYEYT